MKLVFPKVSVVISTFERPEMLREAIDSVLAQTFTDWELIVVDDGSNTAEAVGVALKDEGLLDGRRYAFINMDEPSGYQCAPKNVGIQQAQGSYIAYLDDDNLWDPHHLQVLVDGIEKMGADFVYSRWRYVGDGPFTGQEMPHVPMTEDSSLSLTTSPGNNFIDSSSILHSKAAIEGLLGSSPWDTERRRFGDWHLACACVRAGVRFYGVDSVTFTYRWHGENLQLTRAPSQSTVGFSHDTMLPQWEGMEESVVL